MEPHISSATNCERKECSITMHELDQLLKSQPRKHQNNLQTRRQIHRVPLQMRLKRPELYDPVMVSLGPYHHGKPELHQAEEFKYLCLDWCASFSEEKKASYYNSILGNIDEIRGCYADVSVMEKYDDKALALMMLLDACFILNYIENRIETKDNFLEWRNCLGVVGTIPFATRDILLLENQIPFQVLKLIISLQDEKDGREDLIMKFLSLKLSVELEQGILGEDEEPFLHILEACHRVIVMKQKNINSDNRKFSVRSHFYGLWPKYKTGKKKKDESVSNFALTYTSRSVMQLKSKGIYFSPSPFHSFRDIRFKSRALYGELQLPIFYLSDHTQNMLCNIIAYEISPNTKTDLVVLSYTNFMKSLIESPADVKELQERGILLKRFANNEHAVEMFKNIDTCGLVDFDVFRDVKYKVEEHCSNRVKTWIAGLILTRFKSPWTVVAMVASLLFCFTFLQTIFTIHPANKIS